MKINTLTLKTILLLIKFTTQIPKRLEDLEGIVKIYKKEKIEEIIEKEENIFLAFCDKELLNKADIRLYSEFQKAVEKLTKENYSLKFGILCEKISEGDKEKYSLHPHSLPKILFFKDFGKEVKVYKGGKMEKLIQAWVKRNLRKIGLSQFYIKRAFQMQKKLFMVYFGDEKHEIFQFFKNEFWLKNRDFPAYRLMNFSLLKEIGCGQTNKTEKNFVFVISKNSTYSPCATFYYTDLTEIRSVISQMLDIETKKNLEILSFADNLERLFKAKDKFFLFYDESIETPEYKIYEDFCKKTPIECFFELSDDKTTTNFKKYFLGLEDKTEKFLYFINTEEVYPSKKYRIKNFYDTRSLLEFKDKVLEDKWERFYVSEKEIPEQRKKNPNVWITTADSYKKDIKEFKGDVVLMLANSQNRDNDMVYLGKYYEIARVIKEDYGNVPIKFMAIDVTRNDMPEFANQGTPLFFLYDYISKEKQKIVLYKDVGTSVGVLKNIAPSFGDPELEDL